MGHEHSKSPPVTDVRDKRASSLARMERSPKPKSNSVCSTNKGEVCDFISNVKSTSESSLNNRGGRSSSSHSPEAEEIIVPRKEIAFPSKGSDFDGRQHFMTRRDRLLIVKSWKKTQKTGAEHVGSKIFLRVLTAQPDIKMIFGLEKIPQGRLKYDPRFRQHAIVFTKTFDYAVKNIEYAEKLEHHFDALGRRHVAMQGRGFDPSYWETFAECMTQTAIEWEQHRHRPTTSAWRTLVSSIIMFMRRGYDDEMAKKRGHRTAFAR